jgi:hypothetical protein
MPIIYPSQGLFPRWPFSVNYSDLTDEVIKKLGDAKICASPDPALLTISASSYTVVDDPSILYASSNDLTGGVGKLTLKNINSTAAITVSHKNYYYNAVKALIDFAQRKGIDESQLIAVNPCHYQIVQWQIAHIHWRVCADNEGLNDNVSAIDDKYHTKAKGYHAELITIGSQITMEMFYTSAMQQNQTRAGCGQFPIMT